LQIGPSHHIIERKNKISKMAFWQRCTARQKVIFGYSGAFCTAAAAGAGYFVYSYFFDPQYDEVRDKLHTREAIVGRGGMKKLEKFKVKIEISVIYYFWALRASATPKIISNYMSIEIRALDFVPEFFLFFWDAQIFQKKWCGLLLGLQNL